MGLAALAVMAFLQREMINHVVNELGYAGDVKLLRTFDFRMGYSVKFAELVMTAWDTKGRYLFLAIEIIDLFVLIYSYRIATVLLFNYLIDVTLQKYGSFTFLRYIAFAPIILSNIDVAETLCHFVMTAAFEQSQGGCAEEVWWQTLVQQASAFNRIKWIMAYMIAYVSVPVLSLAFTSAALRYGSVGKAEIADKTGDGAGQTESDGADNVGDKKSDQKSGMKKNGKKDKFSWKKED
jgi:hypothetical protein